MLDEFDRIIPDNPNTQFHDVFLPDDTGIGRLRVGIQPLTDEHLARINNVLAPEPQMPELRCTFQNSQTGVINGVRQCDELTTGDATQANDYTAGDFRDGVAPTLENEPFRFSTDSYLGAIPDYAFQRTLFADTDNNTIPDLYEAPDGPSLPTFGTATYGSLVSAHNYMRGSTGTINDVPNGFTVSLQQGDSSETPLSSSTENPFISEVSQCTVSSFILLITDGQPFTLLDGSNITTGNDIEQCTNPILNNIPESEYECIPTNASNSPGNNQNELEILGHARNSIAPLLAAMRLGLSVNVNGDGSLSQSSDAFNSIQTFVFGFAGINAAGAQVLQTLAAAGSDLVEVPVTDDNGNPVVDDNNQVVMELAPREAFISDDADELEADLLGIFAELSPNITTNSGFSISSSPVAGGGAIVSPSYVPIITSEVEGGGVETVYWTGEVTSFFLDEFGFFREDVNQNGILEGYGQDFAFTTVINDDGESVAQRLEITDPENLGTTAFNSATDITLGDFVDPTPIWSASEQLNSYPQTVGGSGINLYGEVQRPYDEVAAIDDATGYRSIFTAFPDDDGNFDKQDFLADIVTNDNFGLFAVDSVRDAQDLIRFTRGQEEIPVLDANGDPVMEPVPGAEEDENGQTPTQIVTKFRPRTMGEDQFLLGDIVHSSPVVVGVPEEDFGISDPTYVAFQEQYLFRRRMVYVGGNDGLLHAFNGGFFQAGVNNEGTTFATQASAIGCTGGDCDNVGHELGAEVWAYAPYNLLPHLQFISEEEYRSNVHVAFVDGPVQSFDVQAFDNDDTHPGGWGTIIVANMRLGGSPFMVDPDGDGPAETVTTRSAYVVLDVTDPSQEPEVLAEIMAEDIGFTTSLPTVQREGNEWFLVFGSGPNNIIDFTSEPEPEFGADGEIVAAGSTPRTPRFYRYNLNDGELLTPIAFGEGNGFVGDVVSEDWDSDLTDDAVYFGVVGGDTDNPSGGVYRFVSDPNATFNQGTVQPLFITPNQAISSVPVTTTNNGANWVLFGSGRILNNDDFESTERNSFYGIIEPRGDYPNQTNSDIANVTGISVDQDGVLTPAAEVASVEFATQTALGNEIVSNEDVAGWVFDLQLTDPSERVTANPVIIGDQVVFASFIPGQPIEDQCLPVNGQSFLNIGEISTGIPSAETASFGGLDEDGNGSINRTQGPIGITPILQLAPIDARSTDSPGVDSRLATKDQDGNLDSFVIETSTPSSGRTSWTELEVQ